MNSKVDISELHHFYIVPLQSFNKVIVHNTFAVPAFITSVGIVNMTINEITEIDCKTGKQPTMTGNFHPNGDVDRLYIPRSE